MRVCNNLIHKKDLLCYHYTTIIMIFVLVFTP